MKRHSAIGLLICASVIAAAIVYHRFSLEGLDGALFSLGSEDDTKYAPGYSDKLFRSITVGMTTNQLTQTLGMPLAIWSRDTKLADEQDATYIWKYTVSPNDTHYHMRTILVRNGIVVGKHSEFYLD